MRYLTGQVRTLDAALQQIRALILRYDSICSAVARSNGETWLDTSRGYMTVSEAVALRSRLNDKETADTAFEQLLTNRLESILKKQRCFPSTDRIRLDAARR